MPVSKNNKKKRGHKAWKRKQNILKYQAKMATKKQKLEEENERRRQGLWNRLTSKVSSFTNRALS